MENWCIEECDGSLVNILKGLWTGNQNKDKSTVLTRYLVKSLYS